MNVRQDKQRGRRQLGSVLLCVLGYILVGIVGSPHGELRDSSLATFHADPIYGNGIRFPPETELLSVDSRAIRHWRIPEGPLLHTQQIRQPFVAEALSPDGRFVVGGDEYATPRHSLQTVIIVDTNTGRSRKLATR